MCKHVAAALYGVGARLDEKPDLFFTLRGVDMQELITAASATATAPVTGVPAGDGALAGADLTEIFGVEIESAPAFAPAAKSSLKPARSAKTSRQQRSSAASTRLKQRPRIPVARLAAAQAALEDEAAKKPAKKK
jgi:uncharacterized Zn finger protein